ncbi:nucleolar MIF4G domain-containing protein 1-like protein, partial [Tanacetum coccineum]
MTSLRQFLVQERSSPLSTLSTILVMWLLSLMDGLLISLSSINGKHSQSWKYCHEQLYAVALPRHRRHRDGCSDTRILSQLVELLKSCDYKILAIGDGGNDVRMTQQADIDPKDWDDKEFIVDPEDKKPEGYDDIKKEIPDPNAKKVQLPIAYHGRASSIVVSGSDIIRPSRGDGTQIIIEEILTSCSSGPRDNEQYAAVFASLVFGLACLVGIDFGAKLLASLTKCFE